jgi:hypothetical protein
VKLLFLTLFLFCAPFSVLAQSKVYAPPKIARDTSTFWMFKDITVGPYFTAGLARQNGDIPSGWRSDQTFAYTFGGTVDGSINRWLGLNLTLLYDSRNLYFASDGDSNSIDLNVNYIALQPSIRIAWFLMGLAIDIPMSGSATETVTYLPKTKSKYESNLNVDTKDLSMLMELRGTAAIPMLQLESGMLHFIFSANYPLTKTLAGSSFDTTGVFHNLGTGKLPTVEAGLSYQFDILH